MTVRTLKEVAPVRAGEVYENPRTGERVVIRKGTDEAPREVLQWDLYLAPGGAVVGEHVHPAIDESFTLIRGRIGFRISGREEVIDQPGRRVDLPAGTRHDWWNAGDVEARLVVEVSPAARFEQMVFRQLFGLAQDGKVNGRGMPNLLQTAVLSREFADVLRFTKTPALVQLVMYGTLAPLARVLGYRGIYADYQGRRPSAREALEPLPADVSRRG
jgi:quercetin dioxygenase-like cupin family protein